jgi:acetolactate synthase-1/2/3 large subunit
MVTYSGARALFESLKKERVELIFGLPGGAILPIYDELLDSGIRHVLTRHEQTAAHMADGYARASGKVGVAMATSGPGTTNLVTGIANAYMDSSPVVAITGQVPTAQLGTDAFQETDTLGLFNPITKYVFQPRTVEDVPHAVKAAFYLASTGRTAPVVVDIPKDVQMGSAEVTFPESVSIRGYVPYGDIDRGAIEEAARMLLNAQRPVILAGGGVIRSGSYDALVELAEYLMIPVATTLMGKGSIPETHPLAVGTVGMHGTYQANLVVTEADLVLSVGVRFSDRSTMDVEKFSRDRKIIHIDIDPTEINKNVKSLHFVIGELRATVTALLEAVQKRAKRGEGSAWSKRVKELRDEYDGKVFGNDEGISPPSVIKKMRELLSVDSIVTTEVGQNQMWAQLHFKALKPRTFITSGGLGTMGFGFPAAIGAKAARPGVPVLDIAGDGSFQMTCNALATSVSEDLPVIVCILNNSMLGMVAQWQRMFYRRRYSGVKLGTLPNFVQLAKAFGAEGIRVQSLSEFENAFKEALRCPVTTIIDVPVSAEEDVFPIVPSGGALKDMVIDT